MRAATLALAVLLPVLWEIALAVFLEVGIVGTCVAFRRRWF
ncbi:hypothetical protein PC116_g30275 [Phytophthora cactorum]|nr:hypothetical protein PC116_g30275 [Phytophthora cactorum]